MKHNSYECVNRASTIAGVPPLASSMMTTPICGNNNGSINSSNEAEQFASVTTQRQRLFNVRSTRFQSPSHSNCMSDGASQAELADDNNNFYVTRGDLTSFYDDGVSPAARATAVIPSLLSRQMLSNCDMVNSKSGCSSPSCVSIRSTASWPAPKSTKDTTIDMHDSRMAIQDERPQANLNYGVLPDLSLKLDIDNDLLNAANHTIFSQLSTHHVPQASQAPNKYSWDSNVYPSPKHGKEGKIKASNVFVHRLEIGSWKNNANEGGLVAKFYFAKRKLVWEVLEGKRKKKIEFSWCDIEAMRVDTKGNEDWDTWEVDLNCTPSFYSEMDPEPRRHTLWESCKDFTNGEAYDHLTHRIIMQKNQHFLRQFQKLLAQDPRLAAMMTPEGQQAAVCRIQTPPKAGRKRAVSFSAQTLANGFHYDIEACALVSCRALLVHTDNLHQQSMEDVCGRRGTSSSDDSAVSLADTMSNYTHQFHMASGVSTPAVHFSSGAHQWQPGYHSHHGASPHGSPSSNSVSSGPSSTLMGAGQHQGHHFLQISNRSGTVSSQQSPMEPFYINSNVNPLPSMNFSSNANAAPSMNFPMDGSKVAKVAGRSIRMESEIPHQQDMLAARGMEYFTANHAGPNGTDPGFSFNREQLMGALGGAVNPNKRHCQNGPSYF